MSRSGCSVASARVTTLPGAAYCGVPGLLGACYGRDGHDGSPVTGRSRLGQSRGARDLSPKSSRERPSSPELSIRRARRQARRYPAPMARRRTRQLEPQEMRLLLERARRFALQAPRKHHVVPASYLTRWARKGAIRVTDLQTRKAYSSSPEKVARRTDYYRL